MTKHEEHLHCQIPYFFMDELAKHDYEHSQHQAEGLSNDVNTQVDVSGPLDSKDKTTVRIRCSSQRDKRKIGHGSEPLKQFYLWSTTQTGPHATISIKQFSGFPVKTDRTKIIQGKQVHYLVSSEERRKAQSTQTKWRIKTKLKIQSGGNDWQLHEETNLVNGPESVESGGREEE